jgi:pyrroline-5-carboxylate reductase
MKLGFFGCGNMGESFLRGIIQKELCTPEDILVCDKTEERLVVLKEKYSILTTLDSKDLENCDILFLGFKPQNLVDIQFSSRKGMIVISMLAGKQVSAIGEKFLNTKIVRIMPNIGQFVEQGMTGLFFGLADFSSEEKTTIRSLLASGGTVLDLETEQQIDWIGAISGSGPAYFFRFAEALQSSAEQLGFAPDQAEMLVRQTLIGSAYLLQNNPDDSCSLWRERVTSPKGTTEQALRIFNEQDIDTLVKTAIDAAMKRTQELGKD